MYMQQGRLVIISFTLATACIFMTQQCFFAESFSKPSLIPKKFFKTVEGTHTVLRKKLCRMVLLMYWSLCILQRFLIKPKPKRRWTGMQKWPTVLYLQHFIAKYSTLSILPLLSSCLPLTAHASKCSPVLYLHFNPFYCISS